MNKILVVDDEPGVRVVITEILNRAGFETVEASDGDEGLQPAERRGALDLQWTESIGLYLARL